MGDAMTWICLLRLVSSWFPARRIPFVTPLTGTLGQLGAIVAAVPMTWALGHLGWTQAYLIAASLGIVVAIAAVLVAARRRARAAARCAARGSPSPPSAQSLRASWAHPGTRLGLLDALRRPSSAPPR